VFGGAGRGGVYKISREITQQNRAEVNCSHHTYPAALLLMMLSMLCWGSWANTQKIDAAWRFELFYLDYTFGLLAASILFGLTLGRTDPSSSSSFFANFHSSSSLSVLKAFIGGAIFGIGNILLVAAISVAGMAVAFPVGASLALWGLGKIAKFCSVLRPHDRSCDIVCHG